MTLDTFYELTPTLLNFRDEVLKGLAQTPKRFLPQFLFHDPQGSDLFNQICELPEYYVTRTEMQILKTYGEEITAFMGSDYLLMEYGSGGIEKVYYLLNAQNAPKLYAPIDIAQDHLQTYVEKTRQAYPHIQVTGIHGDFTQVFTLPDPLLAIPNKVILFAGGTIGNLDRSQAVTLLQQSAQLLNHQGHMLIGVDLKKDPVLLHAAYNDSRGITKEFNLNILRTINRELNANFDLDRFYHYAPYNPNLGRIEMHLVSTCAQTVTVSGQEFYFREGETIHTENSHKYSVADFKDVATAAGFTLEKTWTDPDQLFSVHWLRC